MTTVSLTIRQITPFPSTPSPIADVTHSQSVTHVTETDAPEVSVRNRGKRGKQRYLTAKDDPVLARTWDNEDDAIYDNL